MSCIQNGIRLVEMYVNENFIRFVSQRIPTNGPACRLGHSMTTASTMRTDADQDVERHLAWIARMANGDDSALADFYDCFVSRVYGVAIRIVRDPMVAEEVVSDTFLQIWRSSGRYNAERGKPIAWLLNMARSRAIDALRRLDRAESVEDPLKLLERGQDASQSDYFNRESRSSNESSDPVEVLTQLNRDKALLQALSALNKVQRQVIYMAYFQGCTHKEIAERVSMPLGTVKSHIRRAQHLLKSLLSSTTNEASDLH